MARIDKEKFPLTIIMIPEAEFPDELSIFFEGNNMSIKSKAGQIAAQTADESLGSPVSRAQGLPNMFTQIRESQFKTTKKINNVTYKFLNINTPYTNLASVQAWASRNNFEDNRDINIKMFTSGYYRSEPGGPQGLPGLGGSWSRDMTLRKQFLSVEYIANYFTNGTAAGRAGQIGQQIMPLVSESVKALASSQLPNPPTVKGIAAKLMSAAAAPVQQALAEVAVQLAEFKPKAEQVVAIVNAIKNIAENPAQAKEYIIPVLLFAFEFVPKEKIAENVHDFYGEG